MKKGVAKFKAPDVEKDRELLCREAQRYIEELKAGTLVPEDFHPDDKQFAHYVENYSSLALDELAKLVDVLRELEKKGKRGA